MLKRLFIQKIQEGGTQEKGIKELISIQDKAIGDLIKLVGTGI
jgi:hypothetical protein